MIDINQFENFLSNHHHNIQTPCYFYSPNSLIRNYESLKRKLGTKLIVSLKANNCIDLHTLVSHVLRDGYEVASLKELNSIANTSKNHPKYINNPSMNKTLLRAGLGANATIIIDSEAQVELLKEIAKTNFNPSLMIRLNGSILNEFIGKHVPFREDHFGTDLKNLPRLIKKVHALGYKIRGFHLFKGSNTFSRTAISTIEGMVKIIPILQQQLGYAIEILNLGGGFSADFLSEVIDFDFYRASLKRLPSSIEVIHEAGRALFASAGLFLTRITAVKKLNKKIIAVCDGGIAHNFLLCQTEKIIKQYLVPILFSHGISKNIQEDVNSIVFVGNSCSQDDVIAKINDKFMVPNIGDICVFQNCGAYNETYTVANFLGLDKAVPYIWQD